MASQSRDWDLRNIAKIGQKWPKTIFDFRFSQKLSIRFERIFSRRFMKWNAIIIVTFFQSTRTDQNSSWKFCKILWSQIESFGLANWTKKVFSVFPRNIPYRERLKGPSFSFFSALWDFFFLKNSPKVPPSIFWCFATEWMLNNPKGWSPFSVFFGIETFFRNFFFTKGSPFNFWCFVTMDVKKCERVPLLAHQFGRLGFSWVWYSFCEFDTLSFLRLSCPLAIFEP